ncbi:spindle and centriole-associated protein 1 isoform X2 [Dunckerocampus dactyliophorus]|uniref:spindle and centriole-associated protein 1 isoform X2 n=1 Tax=Dunckerocampus dactyliophorus TaxID=161453 RepID=UPI0024073B85|nr:spindle and centriole-associated protein 1 isoform X2 [Dunckerocampus dactyliophorus]
MSFVRGGCRPQQNKAKKTVVRHKKTAPLPKREWVSTVNDLSVHKLTPLELNHRHEIHKSRNKVAAQWELREKAIKGHPIRQAGSSPGPLDESSLTILREVFADKLLLQDVLAGSDRAMALVKNIFGDAPRKQTGHPCVTMVPSSDLPPTQLSLFGESMLDQQVVSEPEDDYDNDDTSTTSLIQRKMKAKNKVAGVQRQKVRRGISEQTFSSPRTPCTSARVPALTALNATLEVQRLRSRQNQSLETHEEPSFLSPRQSGSCRPARTRKRVCKPTELNGSSVASLSGDQSSLGLLQALLGQVEGDLNCLSPETGPASRQSQQTTHSLTGFSVALVSTLGRLVHLLKKRQEEAESAAEERRQLEEKLREQRGLIDALTAESMTLREEATSLQVTLQQQTAELERKLDCVALAMAMHIKSPQGSDVIAAGSASVQQPVAERPLVAPLPVVRLSSPGHGDLSCRIPDTHPGPLHQDAYNKLGAHCSASNLTSLSSSLSLTSNPHLSLEAMEAEITELCKLNDVIKAQISQDRAAISGVGGLLGSGEEQGGLISSSAGRVTPQSVSATAATPSQHIKQQGTPTSNMLSVSIVQQRLLELNKQSAVARGRLLELIEQQKHNVSAKVSPSASPIPPSAFSPQPEGRGSSDRSFLMPSEEPLSKVAAGDRGSSGCEVYSQHYEEAGRNVSTQKMDKRRVPGGWFALSTHTE